MKKIYAIALATLALSACNNESRFKVTGEVTDAEGKMLYLEASALQGIIQLDSIRLKGSGSFTFHQPRPESPEFYRLRIEQKVINFSVDSTETVKIDAPYETFATHYTVSDSPNSENIKELTLKQIQLQNSINTLTRDMQSGRIGMNAYNDSLAALINAYKDDVKQHYIFAAPNTAAAYFALFQKVNDYLIFDPLNSKDDIKCFAAVATSLNNFYPHADRSRNLYNIVIKGMKNTRPQQQKTLELPEDKFSETGILDISLRDIRGNVRKLSDLKGKVVLLDFTIYQSAVSTPHNFQLNALYEKYHAKGLEIYQVSLDADEHFWKTTADNLPWVCVRDADGVNSSVAAMYTVQTLPALFLIDRNNDLSARGDNIQNLDEAVRKLL
jgi:peroxiredoxin